MSTASPREEAATQQARTQGELAQQLQGIAFPELQAILGKIRQDIGPGGEPQSIASAFGAAENQLNTGYDMVGQGQKALIAQQQAQSGGLVSDYQAGGSLREVARALDQDRRMALRNLEFQRQTASLGQYNTLLRQLGQTSGYAFNLAQGATGNQLAAISGMSGASPLGSTLGGAAGGAASGAAVGGWPGAIVGGIAGGAAGYFGSG